MAHGHPCQLGGQPWISVLSMRFSNLKKRTEKQNRQISVLSMRFKVYSDGTGWTTTIFHFCSLYEIRKGGFAISVSICSISVLSMRFWEQVKAKRPEFKYLPKFLFSLWDSKLIKISISFWQVIVFLFSLWDSRRFDIAQLVRNVQNISVLSMRFFLDDKNFKACWEFLFLFSLWDSRRWCEVDNRWFELFLFSLWDSEHIRLERMADPDTGNFCSLYEIHLS